MTTNPITSPIHHSDCEAKAEVTAPVTRTTISIGEIRKPGLKGGVFMAAGASDRPTHNIMTVRHCLGKSALMLFNTPAPSGEELVRKEPLNRRTR